MPVSRTRWTISIIILLILVGIIIIIKTQLKFYEVISDSMYPTLRKGDYVYVDTYKTYTPARGDIVALYDPTMPGDNIVKRIVGIPNDLIEVKPTYILVNGVKENEVYLNHKRPIFYKHIGTIVLKDNEYFVLGDNRNISFDSREFGPVPDSDITGRVKRIYWPPSRMGKVK